ncbi:hypothetical protein PR202_ga01522 [Eleusine coracana subsp. coracana]|uniref:Uncharacterized protein n=1 Tax=Eleusine coracana subsp. coracana TaxID=191504 RepID=A0AAV5BHJ5_ELECO|nr:hypothetical protein PR202_ga00835 [Eleusine coracana subsp. coracana]GJM85728.1 hypothetical protein PR202_ga01522 [Eleusine coracana subsp. coracana]
MSGDIAASGTPTSLMENPSKKESETDKSAPRRRRKAGLRFAPKAIAKNAPVIIPKVELNEESKVAAIDKQLQLKLRTPKSTDALGSRPKAEKKDVPAAKLPKKHDDPWDYTSTNYPVTLPMLQRRPYSRDPDLDEDEFGQSSSKAHDGELTAAEELGLMVRMDEPQLLFFQLPRSLPLQRQPDQVDEADTDTNVDVNAKSEGDNRKKRHYPIHGCKLRELPGGLMGKILVYRSGKVKMKLSDAL